MPPRLDQVLVEEHLQGPHIGQVTGIDQISGQQESSRRVMSKNHVDS
jgi:hypothetical protein